MSIEIDRPTLLKEKMQSGINLFTGAGFSCLPNESGDLLPTSSELCTEICTKFALPDTFSDDLETLSELAPRGQYQNYLRNRFTVSEYNKSYDSINKLNLLTFITTNIDNIIHKVMDNSSKYFLKSITQYGAPGNGANELTYIPLHGDVVDANSYLYFGKFDLANVDTLNNDLFQLMHSRLLTRPTLFWGYGFHDIGVLKTVSRLVSSKPHDIWVQCMPDNKKGIELFRAKGCNVVVANTQELLAWIDSQLLSSQPISSTLLLENESLKPYFIPSISQVESIPIDEYYQEGNTHWHPVLSNRAFEFPIISDIYEKALENKNVILYGGSFTGKTTSLMQIALKVDSANKFFIDKITPEQARFIAMQIGNEEAWIFYHNCAEDIDAFKVFAIIPNVHLIGVADDYRLESTKHILAGVSYKSIEIGELDEQQAQLMYDFIPESLRNATFVYKNVASDKYSMFEMIANNVREVQTQLRVKEMLTHMYKNDYQAFETVLLTAYLSDNGSALTTDILVSYFSLTSYEDVKIIFDKAKSLLKHFDFGLQTDETDQDYFSLRSRLFAYHAKNVLIQDRVLRQKYREAIEKFIFVVVPYKIYRYDIFRRKAYDSDLFFDLFKEHSNDIYAYIYNYDQNPYTLQQWALCRARLNQFTQAFVDIDNALSQRPNNFSMKNSQAIILFEANKDKKTVLSVEKMKEAMEILRNCYNNDKRKIYHAQKYAEFSIVLADNHAESQYLSQALSWINEVSQNGSISRRTKRLQRDLSERISII